MIDVIGNKCTGCFACVSKCPKGCISMEENAEGFRYPRINTELCVKCNLCEKACPILSPIANEKTDRDIKVYAVRNKDEEVRAKSSSGGAFSAIASYVLKKGGVVFGAAFDENFEIVHTYVESEEEMFRLRGSKYVQSKIGDAYKQAKDFLEQGRMVLFSGTACQTSGLLGYLGKDYDNLITQDLVCHGVPSPMVWRKYLKLRQQLAKSPIKSIFFRDKTYGWHNWHIAFDFEDGTQYKRSQFEDRMIVAFLRGKCSRECCYDCQFKQKCRLADFTLADLWGVEGMAAELDDDKGLSACFVNSPKAAAVFEEIKEGLIYKEVELDKAVNGNLAMIESEKLPDNRKDFLRDMGRKPFDMVSGKYIDEAGFATRLKWTVRRLTGDKIYDAVKNKLTGK